MESQPQNPEFRINPENFHPCGQLCDVCTVKSLYNAIFGVERNGRCYRGIML